MRYQHPDQFAKGNRNPLLSNHHTFNNVSVSQAPPNNAIDNSQAYIKEQTDIVQNAKRINSIPSSFTPSYNDMYTAPGYISTGGYSSQRCEPLSQHGIPIRAIDRYDEVGAYLSSHGLMDRDNVVRYETHYVNINSAMRKTKTTFKEGNPVRLCRDPLKLSILQTVEGNEFYELTVNQPNHPYKEGDFVSIYNVEQKIVILNTKSEDSTQPFIFINGSAYLQINYENISGLNPVIYNNFWQNVVKPNLFVNISGFEGDIIDGVYTPYIGNIPINYLNNIHNVIFVANNNEFDKNVIYISLPQKFIYATNEYIFKNSYNITLKFEFIHGIPLNQIDTKNSELAEFVPYFQLVKRAEKDFFVVNIFSVPGNDEFFGGNNVSTSLVKVIDTGYPTPSQYRINLGKTYDNVVVACLVSSEFPNSGPAVNNNNNKFYWQDEDSGNLIYSVMLNTGTYEASDLARLIEILSQKPIVNYINTINVTSNVEYDKIIRTEIDLNTSICTFRSYKKSVMQKPITGTIPNLGAGEYPQELIITMQKENHGLQPGSNVLIENCLAYMGIPADKINGLHKVLTNGHSQNQFSFQIKNINYVTEGNNNGGGNDVLLLIPNSFRLRMDFSDSIGSILGFRNVGDPASITKYKTVQTNNDSYILPTDFYDKLNAQTDGGVSGNTNYGIIISKDKKILNNNTYILMLCKQFAVIDEIYDQTLNRTTNNPEYHVFAKIQLDCRPSRILYNTFVPNEKFFFNPIQNLSELDIEFVDPFGKRYDFQGLDHSYMLKIVTLTDRPKGTGLIPNLGKYT